MLQLKAREAGEDLMYSLRPLWLKVHQSAICALCADKLYTGSPRWFTQILSGPALHSTSTLDTPGNRLMLPDL